MVYHVLSRAAQVSVAQVSRVKVWSGRARRASSGIWLL